MIENCLGDLLITILSPSVENEMEFVVSTFCSCTTFDLDGRGVLMLIRHTIQIVFSVISVLTAIVAQENMVREAVARFDGQLLTAWSHGMPKYIWRCLIGRTVGQSMPVLFVLHFS